MQGTSSVRCSRRLANVSLSSAFATQALDSALEKLQDLPCDNIEKRILNAFLARTQDGVDVVATLPLQTSFVASEELNGLLLLSLSLPV
jgi:hypothetical protein